MSLALTSRRAALLPGRWVSNELWRRARAVPSLDLRFAENKSLVDSVSGQNLITFTRASTGTYVDSDGVIRSARTNLLLWSEEFDNAVWVKNKVGTLPIAPVVTANQDVAPDGTLTADRVVFNLNGSVTTNDRSQMNQITSTVAGRTYTFSVWMRSADGISRVIRLSLDGLQPTDVTVTSSWQRFTVTAVATDAVRYPRYEIRVGTPTSTYADIYIWGAQFEEASTVGEYIKTTSSISGAPRFDHNPLTGECLGLLVEEQRQNLLLRSEEFDNASWNDKVNGAVTQNSAASPSGTTTADRFVPTAMTGLPFIAQSATVVSGTTYTWSVFLKADGYSWVFLDAFDGSNHRTWFDLSTGTIGTVEAGNTSTITSFGNGWYRCTITRSAGATSIPYAVAVVSGNNALNITANGTSGILLWGAQLEAGAFPTSYIPTTGTAATRTADVASVTGTNFSSWYRQDAGVMFADYGNTATGSFVFDMIGVGNSERQYLRYVGSQHQYFVVDENTSQAQIFDGTAFGLTSARSAVAYAANDFSVRSNGGASATSSATDAAGTLPTLSALYLGATSAATGILNGHLRRLAYFPQRLPNSTLQSITL